MKQSQETLSLLVRNRIDNIMRSAAMMKKLSKAYIVEAINESPIYKQLTTANKYIIIDYIEKSLRKLIDNTPGIVLTR